MKLINILLSVLILVIAIVLAVSSYFLYEKREMMLNGWQKMSEAINLTAQEFDKNSGTKLAEELTADNLHHTKYADLDTNLTKLNESAVSLVKQRDDLAKAITQIGSILQMPNMPSQKLITEQSSSPASIKDVIARTNSLNARQNSIINSIVASGRLVGASLNANELRKGNVTSVFNTFNGKIRALKTQMNTYEASLRTYARLTGAPAPNFSPAQYKNSLNKIQASINSLKAKYANTQKLLNAERQKSNKLTNDVRNRNNQINTMKVAIGKKNSEVKKLKEVLGLAGKAVPTPWEDGSKEVRKAVAGKVIETNDKFGFYVVNLGKNTIVEQQIGTKINKVNPKFTNGLRMVIARDMDKPDVKFIRRAKITNVSDNCLIVEALGDGEAIKVGDDVFFDKNTLK